MTRFAAAVILFVAVPAVAGDEPLRLVCRTGGGGPQQVFAFSIDMAAKDAVETVTGGRFAVSGLRDHIVLSDGATPVFRIDRVTGAFVVDRQLRMDGMCEEVERKF